jgi:nucleoside-diphosphate-sugar epimerase
MHTNPALKSEYILTTGHPEVRAMRLLITGATGFVGMALCEVSTDFGAHVRAASRQPFDFGAGIENSVIPDLGGIENLSVSSPEALRNAVKDVDVVVHLAARVHVMQESESDAIAAYRRVNVEGTLQLARSAVAAGVNRFIYLSSIKVNGESTEHEHPFTADGTAKPEDPYGVSKLEAEQALIKLTQSTGMELVIIRPPLVYGPGVGANFAAMMRWLSYRLPLPLGSIQNRRSMVGLDNLTDLILRCCYHPAAAGQVFLVSDGHDVSVSELLRRIARLMKLPNRLIPIPMPVIRFIAILLGKRAVAQRLCGSLQVDIEKTRRLLEWNPPVSLDAGLKKTIDWFLAK